MFLPAPSVGQDGETAQRPFITSVLSNSRTEIHSGYYHISPSGVHEIAVQLARTIPLGIERSSLSMQSRVSLIHGSLGLRTAADLARKVRWSAGLLSSNIYRAPIAVGLTILNYDKIGRYDLQARWLDIRLGPAVRWETNWGAVEPRIVGSIGGTSLRPGTVNFPGLGSRADRTVHGFDAGYQVELPARLNYWVLLSLSAGQRILLGRRNIAIRRGRVEAQLVLLQELQLFAQYRTERVKMSETSDTVQSVHAGLRVAF